MRDYIQASVSMRDVAQELVGGGSGDGLVALLEQVTDVVTEKYAVKDPSTKASNPQVRQFEVFISRIDEDMSRETIQLLRMLADAMEKKS